MRRLPPLLALLVPLALTGCGNIDVVNGLTEQDAIRILVLLHQNDVAAQKTSHTSGQDVTWSIRVPEDQAPRAWEKLHEHGEPRTKGATTEDIFRKKDMIPTDMAEKIRWLVGKENDLTATIEAMSGVNLARVHVSVPDVDPIEKLDDTLEIPAPKASVYVKLWGSEDDVVRDETGMTADAPTSDLDGFEDEIRQLVAGAVDGLVVDHVQVVTEEVRWEAPAAVVVSRSGVPVPTMLALGGVLVLLVAVLGFVIVRYVSLSKQATAARLAA